MSIVVLSRLSISFIAGCGLGLFYFGGLWLTVRQLPQQQHPFAWIFSSLLLRLSILLLLFYGIIIRQAGISAVLSTISCFLGLLLVRTLLIQKIGISLNKSSRKA